MSSAQQRLSDYLQYELFHLLGAYGIAELRLKELAEGFEEEVKQSQGPDETPSDGPKPNHLAKLACMASEYNGQLGRKRHGPPRTRNERTRKRPLPENIGPVRDPIPDELPLTKIERFTVGLPDERAQEAREHPWQVSYVWERVSKFYGEALYVLATYDVAAGPSERGDRSEKSYVQNFGASLIAPRDGLADPRTALSADKLAKARDRIWRRTNRYRNRFEQAYLSLVPQAPITQADESVDLYSKYEHDQDFLEQIATDNLSSGTESLPIFVIRAQGEAHLSMHAVEAWKAMCLGEHAQALGKTQREWLDQELKRCIVLSTFAYCVSRTAPWIFAADADECEGVLHDFSGAWENVVPARCMWIAGQVSLLALHRRAYAYALKGEPHAAYNDYHKLQRLIRDAERRARAAPIHVEGALEFLAGLDAQAHHHIGELYRREHAHKPARKHLDAASHRLDLLRDEGKLKDVLDNSRWYVELQISHGKTSYEMGRHKEALCWHLRGWRAFLKLLAADTHTEANTEAIDDAIKWLERVHYEPELRKSEARTHVDPVVKQLDRVTVHRRFGALAGEILLRLGHLLFVLNLGDDPSAPSDPGGQQPTRHSLAFLCLRKAADCDRNSTLIAADLLKARFRFEAASPDQSVEDYDAELAKVQPVTEHWPRGGNDYERLARVAEYLMLRSQLTWSPPTDPGERTNTALIARDLLLNFFMNTDSINVRKSQVHHLLMQEPSANRPPEAAKTPAIEFVCMRRYSSAFPLLPRPSAFRALGGGYFLRLHSTESGSDEQQEPFGIVVDPGVDFVENLYRTGYSLSDINMIAVTHDHVDHLGSLEPLLSLLHERSELLRHEEEASPSKPVTVLVSRSVTKRYKKVTRLWNSKELRFQTIEKQIGSLPNRSGVLTGVERFPDQFEIVAMSTQAIDDTGHLDLGENPAYGLCCRAIGGHPSVAITGDTPPPPAESQRETYEQWVQEWQPALDADVLIAHLSSVPLTELRQLVDPAEPGAMSCPESPTTVDKASLKQEIKAVENIRKQLQATDKRLQGQLEYGLWLRSGEGSGRKVNPAGLLGPVTAEWKPPREHSFLRGMLGWARTYAKTRGSARPGLFVVGELSEELATMRGKVAARLDEQVFNVAAKRRECEEHAGDEVPAETHTNMFSCALSADIGLQIFVTLDDPSASEATSRITVLCTTCNLDTDRVATERYHLAHDVVETCVKGENEGIFYNCLEHDPAKQEDPTFLEQLERFDIFGR